MESCRVMFLYWGRRGLTQFARELMNAAIEECGTDATISVSRQNESFEEFSKLGAGVHPIDTFHNNSGALLNSWRIPLMRRRLSERLRADRTQVVIELMPHVWSPHFLPVIRRAGARFATIVHDADVHPGDYRSRWVKKTLDRSAAEADVVFTLSDFVTQRLLSHRPSLAKKLVTLFHPNLSYHVLQPPQLNPGLPMRLLFLGRIMSYKGLPVFLDAVDRLRAEGHAVEVGVFGEGSLGANAARLTAMGAEVVNRWLTADEIAAILPRFQAIVLSHIEAAQSGIAATAVGAGLPVVATPVGGLVEQVRDGENGVMAESADARALADAIKRLLLNPDCYNAVCENIPRLRASRSMAQFFKLCIHHAQRSGVGERARATSPAQTTFS